VRTVIFLIDAMVAPVRTDSVRTKSRLDAASNLVYYDERQKHWQKQPYTLPLGYFHNSGYLVPTPDGSDPSFPRCPINAQNLSNGYFYDSNLQNLANNKAYEGLKNKVYSNAQLGVDFAEAHQSISMIAGSFSTLVKVARSIRKLDFLSAARALRMKFLPKGVSMKKSFANNWLEFHFGWEPLVHDIYDSVDVLNNPLNAFMKTSGNGSISSTFTYSVRNVGNYDRLELIKNSYSCRQGLTVDAINNSTLHSLDQFGVLNPLSIAWELVPFSFVVDWYANVGEVLSSYSDFAGMSIRNQWSVTVFRTQLQGQLNPYTGSFYRKSVFYSGTGYRISRGSSLITPVFAIKQLRLPSKVRALTAWSLFMQQLRGR
jgi:hypothetical protein